MPIGVVGISHHTAPLAVRERFVFPPEDSAPALLRFAGARGGIEAVLLSTCNRTELYFHAADGAAAAEAAAASLLAGQAGLELERATPYLYRREGRAAVEHLFRVVTSLDSMVVGEAEIQGQVRSAYEQAASIAAQPGVVGPVLSRLFQSALGVGGRVRSETALAMGAASIPSAAVELARKIFGSLRGRRAIVLGAGEMAELALQCLSSEGVKSVVAARRPGARAQELAQRVGGRAISFDDLVQWLPQADIVAAATSAPHVVLGRELVERALPGGPRRPLLVVDIAVPRDVDPAVGGVPNLFLYDLDDLRQIVEENLGRRRAEIPAAERLVAEAATEYWNWYLSLDVIPLIRTLRGQAEQLRRAEVEKALGKLRHLAPEDRERIESLTQQLLNKLLHVPTVRLREAAANGRGASLLDAARYLFELDSSDTTSTNT